MIHNDFLNDGSRDRPCLHGVRHHRMIRRLVLYGGAMPANDSGKSVNSWDAVTPDIAWQWLLTRRQTDSAPPGPLSVNADGRWQSTCPVTPDARELLDCWVPRANPMPWVVAQLGQSLDGRIATESGHSHYINGQESLVHLHRLRAMCDAVVIGAGTACADNPRLTVRHVSGDHPLRVILDPRGRVPASLALLSDGSAPTLHLVGNEVELPAAPAHVSRHRLAVNANGQFAPRAVIETLGHLGHRRILVEGGGITVSRFIETGCIDHLHLLVAPLLIGSGRPGLQMTPIDTLDTALRPPTRRFTLGDDTLFELDLGRA
ncbi:RibD family protein [Halomonas sp. LS-001]